MTDRSAPPLAKWPFLVGDFLLLVVAVALVYEGPVPLKEWQSILCVLSVAIGAWLAVTPFILEYRATLHVLETQTLATTVEQIGKVEDVARQIQSATAQWQTVQEHATSIATAARTMADTMTVEAKAFGEFLQKANDTEKNHLRLEVEKLRRSEGDWLQVIVRILDNTHVLHLAGVRSGQPRLIEQLTAYQAACRDIARRVGLVVLAPADNERFDSKTHQVAEGEAEPAPDARVMQVLAPGFTYQGQLLRRAVVVVRTETESVAVPTPESAEKAAEDFPTEESTQTTVIADELAENSPEHEPVDTMNEGPYELPPVPPDDGQRPLL